MDMVKHAMASADNQKTPSSTSGGGNDNNNNNKKKLYKGVRKRKWGKWVSEIRLPNSRERIWLGSYDSPEKAARAFDAALYCLRGRRASFNFPDTPFNLDINVAVAGDQSLTPHEIQEVAAKFANNNNNNDQEDPPLVVDNNSSSNDNHQESHIDQQLQRPSGNSNSINSSRSHIGTESSYTTASSSTNMYECEGSRVQQVDQHGDTIDWTFLNVLDDSNSTPNFAIGSDDPYNLYSHELDKMHSGELLYSTLPPPTTFEDFNGDEIEGDDPFSHQSFLWNWNF